ncbi:fatty acid cis/trans isomerase [Niveibacterium sp. COAC-50]|uniref:fatty acid cis/trans isomerase n=1 Tax=Niveibacterium sp. COAC-50 TaxID=2729384 RepID=UPI0015538BB7|nr:fatty acid cis/trans isomerase [Niveibacterium sp. COAC-50]
MPVLSPTRLILLATLLLAGCGMLAREAFEREHAPADPTRYDHAVAPSAGQVSYRRQIQPLLGQRCVVCHACYDAPCQLKLGSWEGIARGISPELVYDGTRLNEAPTTRLFADALRASEWRAKGFAPVLNEREATPAANHTASLLYRALALKQAHPLPQVDVLPKDFDFGLDRKQSCPRIENFEDYARDKPLAGMPYGLPGLTQAEFDLVARWLEQGAPDEGPAPVPAAEQREVDNWERFLNGNSNKERLMSRYLYEHLFLGHLYVSNAKDANAYKLVRSATPPGQPIQLVATRRPFDDPGVIRVFYRLQRDQEPIVAKTHMPYRLDAERMAKYRGWFLKPDYTVDTLPGYTAQTAANPLATFHELPVNSRHRFLLDEAQFFVMNFIKGPVCRGQLALDVIEDRFWVFFTDPDEGAVSDASERVQREAAKLKLPAAWGSDAGLLKPWRAYAEQEEEFVRARTAALREVAQKRGGPALTTIWDGDGHNTNAALTIFRHFDSATVVKGLVGEPPKTAWVMGYNLFERVFYLLSAGFDIYGNIGHQLHSRLYMDFLRMEGETNFAMMLPQAARKDTLSYWYRHDGDALKRVLGMDAGVETAVPFRSDDPKTELFTLLKKRLGPALDTRLALDTYPDAALRRPLQALAAVQGASLDWMPEVAYLEVSDAAGRPHYFSLLRDTGHFNVTHLLRESKALAPAENRLTVVPGFVGAYPNALYELKAADLPALTEAVRGLASEADYRRLADRFAVRRTRPDFWAFSDTLHDAMRREGPIDGGLLDYNRLENR